MQTDPLPKLTADYNAVVVLESVATRPEDKASFSWLRFIYYCAIATAIGAGVTYH